jgi:hypothetical protein
MLHDGGAGMSLEILASKLKVSCSVHGVSFPVGRAALRDWLKCLRETLVKSDRDQLGLLQQVALLLGAAPAKNLARLLGANYFPKAAESTGRTSISHLAETYMEERGIEGVHGRQLFTGFLAALTEECVDLNGHFLASPGVLVYWILGDEAAYHLVGLMSGDEQGIASVELEYLDARLKRFRKTVEQWELEVQWDKENQALDGKYLGTK